MASQARRRFVDFLRLPPDVTPFEQAHVDRLNRVAMGFFALHIPVFAAIAWLNDTGPGLALLLTTLTCVGPALAAARLPARQAAMVMGSASMIMGGLLVHFGQGPMQIEMHFYFFVVLALLSTYGNPAVVLTAAATVTVHHLGVWWLLPASVFNYEASFWVVAVHAAFVVLESTAACFLARNFFDDVIGLEAIVQERTRQLDQKNEDLRLVLDNVGQGFMTVELDGRMGEARSAAVVGLLGQTPASDDLFAYLEAVSPGFAAQVRMHWDNLTDGFLPVDLVLDQMPSRLDVGGRHLRLDYTPILGADGELARLLLVISDVSARVERERAEQRQREILRVFEKVMADKSGFLEFYGEASALVDRVGDAAAAPLVRQRDLHTLKGITGIFGLESLAQACHHIEDRLADEGRTLNAADAAELRAAWDGLRADLDTLLGERSARTIEVADEDYEALLKAVLEGAQGEALAGQIRAWKLDPVERRFGRLAAQADAIAARLGKAVQVELDGGGLRLDGERFGPFWSAFVHALRNAIDHGIEAPEDREAAGKQAFGRLSLAARVEQDTLCIELADDGRGVDWARVQQKAAERGLPHTTAEELMEALFADGVSVRDEASELSGRGVGMAAVRSAARALGGALTLDSRPGRGTTLRFRFPVAAGAVGRAAA